MSRLLPLVAALAVIATYAFVAWLAQDLEFNIRLVVGIVQGLVLVFGIGWVIRLKKRQDQNQTD